MANCDLNDIYSIELLEKLDRMNNKSKSKVDIDLIKKAMIFAKEYHGEQKRDSGEPYYSHPVAVCIIVADHSFRTNSLVASLLHDVVEDTEATVEMIEKEFGGRIAEMVERLTRVKPEGKVSSEEILRVMYENKDKETMIVKLCDRLHNMMTIKGRAIEVQTRVIKETAQIFIVVAIYLGRSDIEKSLFIFFQNTYLKFDPLQFQYCRKIFDNFQPFSLDLQNDINPMYML